MSAIEAPAAPQATQPLPEGQSRSLGAIPQAVGLSATDGNTSNPCPDCEKAAAKPWHGFADCAGCRARGVGRSALFAHSEAWGSQGRRYRALLEQAGVTHSQVKAARAKDALHQEAAKA